MANAITKPLEYWRDQAEELHREGLRKIDQIRKLKARVSSLKDMVAEERKIRNEEYKYWNGLYRKECDRVVELTTELSKRSYRDEELPHPYNHSIKYKDHSK